MSDGDHSPGAVFLTKLFDQTLAAAGTFDTGATLDAGFSALEVSIYARGDTASASTQAAMQFNGDTGSNYDYALIRNSGGSANATRALAATSFTVAYIPAASATASYFGSGWILIPAYDNTVGFKTGTAIHGEPNQVNETWAETFTWRSTAAINRIKVAPGAGNFVVGSRMIVYGRP